MGPIMHAVILFSRDKCEFGMSNCPMQVDLYETREEAEAAFGRAPSWAHPHIMLARLPTPTS